MGTLKTFGKYIFWVVGMYLLSALLIFISLNLNYTDMSVEGNIPNSISIEKAEKTKSNARVYGYVSNNKELDLNEKFIKISVLDSSENVLSTQYLKIEGVSFGDKKLFKAYFNCENISNYMIDIVDKNE